MFTYEKDLLPFPRQKTHKLRLLDKNCYSNYLSMMLQYAMERNETKNRKAFLTPVESKIPNNLGREIMTIAEKIGDGFARK